MRIPVLKSIPFYLAVAYRVISAVRHLAKQWLEADATAHEVRLFLR